VWFIQCVEWVLAVFPGRGVTQRMCNLVDRHKEEGYYAIILRSIRAMTVVRPNYVEVGGIMVRVRNKVWEEWKYIHVLVGRSKAYHMKI
jgi:hypothetical protein